MGVLKDWILRSKNDLADLILGVSAIMSFWSNLRLIPIVIFTINIFVFKRHIKSSLVFLAIASTLWIYSLIPDPELEAQIKEFNRKGFHAKMQAKSQNRINILAQNIDEYKRVHGHLPQSLQVMQKNSDIADVSFKATEGSVFWAFYYYEILDSTHYYLGGVGRDGLPKTKDDIRPNKDQLFEDHQ
ncbi:MAG TPA: hypothetical protein VGK10_10750 [Prolixibacteraceae bacterium]|jgi:hypothetical protein